MKVISGFQTGADIGSILAAHNLGIPTGGWMPRGWLTEQGPKPEYAAAYGAREHPSADYKPRTIENVKDADATLIIGIKSSGSDLTLKACGRFGKPNLEVRLYVRLAERKPSADRLLVRAQMIKDVRAWLARVRPQVLNIAGNRESVNPGVERWTTDFMTEVLSV